MIFNGPSPSDRLDEIANELYLGGVAEWQTKHRGSCGRAACEKRIADFLDKRGIEIWSGRLELDPVPSTVRYDVLRRDRKCVPGGAAPEVDSEVRLHVDQIASRSKGGSNDMSNLQVLCAECNLGKSNRDETAFAEPRVGGSAS